MLAGEALRVVHGLGEPPESVRVVTLGLGGGLGLGRWRRPRAGEFAGEERAESLV